MGLSDIIERLQKRLYEGHPTALLLHDFRGWHPRFHTEGTKLKTLSF